MLGTVVCPSQHSTKGTCSTFLVQDVYQYSPGTFRCVCTDRTDVWVRMSLVFSKEVNSCISTTTGRIWMILFAVDLYWSLLGVLGSFGEFAPRRLSINDAQNSVVLSSINTILENQVCVTATLQPSH